MKRGYDPAADYTCPCCHSNRVCECYGCRELCVSCKLCAMHCKCGKEGQR